VSLFLNLVCSFLCLLIIAGCQLQGKETIGHDIKDVTRRDLYRTARSSGKILIVDAWQNIQYGDSVRELVGEFHHPDWQLVVKSFNEVTSEELAANPIILAGTPHQNPWITQIMQRSPFTFHGHQFGIGDKKFNAHKHSLVISYYPNPLNVKMPVSVFTSEEESLAWDLIRSRISGLINGNWNYEIIKDRHKVLVGNLSQDPENRWEIDQKQQIELPGNLLNQWESKPFIFRSYHQGLNQSSMAELDSGCQVTLKRIIQLTGRDFTEGPVHYYLYPSTEIKGLMTGNTDQSHFDHNRMEVHTAFDDHFSSRYYGKENQLIIRKLLGKPSFDALEAGLSVYFSANWQQQGFRFWASHLINGGNALTIAQILDQENILNYSPLAREVLAASMVEYLLSNWGASEFLEKYAYWNPGQPELERLNRDWWSWTQTLENTRITYPVGPKNFHYLQGFNFTHEGYQVYNGYGSGLSARSLERVSEIGSNAVAIVPYGWMRDPKSPSAFRFSHGPGSENDEGIIHAISTARKNQLFTLLKPHVWVSGSWPGEVEMNSESEWDLFFDYYYHWISHYALLAEMYNVDAFCIGVEFSRTALKQEKRWRNLIDKVRRIYRGRLTYAANWGEEFENIEFWDQLDFIGLNCYYPLSNKYEPDRTELQKGFEDVLRKVDKVKARYQKPVVFTEIGFRSIESPWQQPHAEAGQSAYNEVHQAICYDVVFRAMSKIPVADGILWWKWPTDLEHRIESDRRFVPGKEAELVVRNWFRDHHRN